MTYLTVRDKLIAAMVTEGRTYKQIGKRVGLCEKRVGQLVRSMHDRGCGTPLPHEVQKAKTRAVKYVTKLQRVRARRDREEERVEAARAARRERNRIRDAKLQEKALAELRVWTENEKPAPTKKFPELTEEDKRMLAEGWERL